MKKILFWITAGFVIGLYSCNNKPEENTSASKAAITDSACKNVTLFTVLFSGNTVKNFEKWKAGYLSDDSIREAFGLTKFILGRGLDNTNAVFVFDKLSDLQQAKKFVSSYALKEAINAADTLITPIFSYIHVIWSDESVVRSKERILIIHKVKDFATWKKVFDEEGSDTRAKYGMVDRAVGQDAADPNLVYILFAVSDMTKAKARSTSPDLLKMMMKSGVSTMPVSYSFRVTE